VSIINPLADYWSQLVTLPEDMAPTEVLFRSDSPALGATPRPHQVAVDHAGFAEALEGGRLDASTVARQQQLFRRLLDAGRSLQKEERDDTDKREATTAKGNNDLKPENTNASGKSALKFREPTWEELRGLTADQRRAILEYFKRINAGTP
jgi:hypothetical protein